MAPPDIEYVQELFAAFGPIEVRRMFGGAGLFRHGLMFGLLHQGVIYLKTDEATSPAFVRENLAPFSYSTDDGERSLMSYRRMPERLYDDAEELARWAAEAFAVARRNSEARGGRTERKAVLPRRRKKR